MNIGVIGAIGVDDMGDVIMLEFNLKLLKEVCKKNNIGFKFTIFTFNMELSQKQLSRFGLSGELVECIKTETLPSDILRKTSFEELLQMDLEQVIDNQEYLKKILACDVLYFIGGGYFNSYWGDKLVSTFILPISLGYQFNIPIFIAGVNIGPFEESQINRLGGVFKGIDTLTVRDREDSIKMLEKLGGTRGTLIHGCDDILSRWYEKGKKDSGDTDHSNKVKYAIIQLHHWVEKYSENYIHFYKEFSLFLDKLIDEKKIDKIYFLPFSKYKGVDYECGRRLKAFMNDRDEFVLLEPMNDYIRMREMISYSEFVIASRYHPIVFGIGEQRPAFAICVNDLYKQKISGAFDVADLDKTSNMIDINDFNSSKLVEWYKKVEIEGNNKNKKLKIKIFDYENDRKKKVESFLLTHRQ